MFLGVHIMKRIKLLIICGYKKLESGDEREVTFMA